MLSLITQPPTQFNQMRDGDRTYEPQSIFFHVSVCVCFCCPCFPCDFVLQLKVAIKQQMMN